MLREEIARIIRTNLYYECRSSFDAAGQILAIPELAEALRIAESHREYDRNVNSGAVMPGADWPRN